MKHPTPHHYTGQVFTMPSEAIPDQTMSIQTILAKYARGEVFSQRIPQYIPDNEYGLDLSKMDLTDIQELALNNEKQILLMQKELKNRELKEAEQQRNDAIQSAAKRLMEQNGQGSQSALDPIKPI